MRVHYLSVRRVKPCASEDARAGCSRAKKSCAVLVCFLMPLPKHAECGLVACTIPTYAVQLLADSLNL